MGSGIDKMKEQQDASDKAVLEQLDTLEKMMRSKVKAVSEQMKNDALQNKSLPIVAVVDTSEKYSVKVSSAPNKEILAAVQSLVGGQFVNALTDILQVALDAFLGNATAGEQFKQDFHILFSNNSLLRLDFMLYKYEFSSKGIIQKVRNGFCYYAQIGVIDFRKVSPQVLLYELTRAIGQKNIPLAEQELKKLAGFATDLFSVIGQLSRAALNPEEGEEEEKKDEEDDDDGADLKPRMLVIKGLESHDHDDE